MDFKATFKNLHIWPPHKAFCVVKWASAFFIDHVFLFGLATSLHVQGCVMDVMVGLLDAWDIPPVFKWVDDFNFMHEPCSAVMHDDGSTDYSYVYDMGDIICLTDRLGFSWHPIDKKGRTSPF